MKLLLLTWNYPPTVGGIEQVAFHTAQGLRALGHHVTILAAYQPPGKEKDQADLYRARKKGLAGFMIHALWKGLNIVRGNRPDMMICPSLTSAPAAWMINKLTGVPYAIQIHGSDLLVPRRYYQALIAPLLSGARLLFANSRNTARLLADRGLRTSRIQVVCPGVTPPPPPGENPTPAIIEELDQLNGRPILLTVGRLIRRKGIKEFMEGVMPDLQKAMPGIVYLVVGGEAKDSLIHQERIMDRLNEVRREKGLEDHVKLLGRLSDADLEYVYRRASVFVLPCLDDPQDVEGFGIVILEAALRGVPAVATRCGGIPDAVADGATGILLPPGNYREMGRQLEALLRDPARRKKLGDTARARALSEFEWNTVVKRYERAIRAALETRT